MKRLTKIFRFLPLLALLFVVACGGGTPASPTVDAAAIYTAAFETAQAQVALTALAVTNTPLATPTSTVTPIAPGPTQTPLITNTPFSLTPIGPTQAQCDALLFITTSYPIGTEVQAGEQFGPIWTIENNGPCTWDDGYGIAWAYSTTGDPMGGPNWKGISGTVKWGERLDIGVIIMAPTTPGTYVNCWRMQNDRGTNFGEFLCVTFKVP